MLDHQEFQSEDDPPDTGEDKSTYEGSKPPSCLPPIVRPPEPPPTPPSHPKTAKETGKWREKFKLGIEIVGLTALVVYTVFSILQWAQIRWTNRLTREALNGNGQALQSTLDKMQAQTDATNNLYREAQKQTVQVTFLAQNTGEQADAAKSSAETSRQSLQVVDRAYLTSGEAEEMLGGWGVIRIPISNTGHVPTNSSSLKVNFERMLIDGKVLEDRVIDYGTKAEIEPGSNTYALVIGMPQMDTDTIRAIQESRQSLLIRAHFHYGDGFTRVNTLELCYSYHAKKGRWMNCSGSTADIDLGTAKHRPEHEEKQ